MKDQRDCIFIDPFMEPNENGIIEKKIKPYEEITEFDELKKLILSKIESLHKYQDMVFFDKAIYNEFFLRCMLFKKEGGNGILIGLGSSGRTSYC